MPQTDALQEAVDVMQRVIDAQPITERDMTAPTPCSDYNISQLADHIIDTHHLLLGAAGGEAPAAKESLSDRHTAAGTASVQKWSHRGTDGTISLGGNELPATFGLSLHTLETYIHAWDLAASLDRPFEPSDGLTDEMWTFAQSFISDDMRGDFDGAPYAAEVILDNDATTAERIIALSGRNPNRPSARS